MSESNENTMPGWINPDDAPELDDYWFDHADHSRNGELVRRGRPVGASKTSTTIRLDTDVLEAFRKEGPGWQTRMNLALREWLANRQAA